MTPVPVDNRTLDWPRKVANAINVLIRRDPRVGDVRYTVLGGLEYFDGEAWQAVP